MLRTFLGVYILFRRPSVCPPCVFSWGADLRSAGIAGALKGPGSGFIYVGTHRDLATGSGPVPLSRPEVCRLLSLCYCGSWLDAASPLHPGSVSGSGQGEQAICREELIPEDLSLR